MDKYHLHWLDAYLGDLMLDDITRDVIDRIKQAKKDQGASNATVNRMLSVPRAILRRAEMDWGWTMHRRYGCSRSPGVGFVGCIR